MADAVSPRLIAWQTSDWPLALSVVSSIAIVESRILRNGCVTAPCTGGRAWREPRFVPVMTRELQRDERESTVLQTYRLSTEPYNRPAVTACCDRSCFSDGERKKIGGRNDTHVYARRLVDDRHAGEPCRDWPRPE